MQSRSGQPGRKAAIVVAVNVAAYLLYAPVMLAMNIMLAVASGALDRASLPENAGRVEQVAGALPFPVPWWVFLIFPVVMAGALVTVRKPGHRYIDPLKGRFVLWASPGSISMLTLAPGVAFTALSGLYYSGGDGVGLWAVPALLSLVVGGVGLAAQGSTP